MIINLAQLMHSADEKHRVSFIMDKLVLPEDIKLDHPLEISLDVAIENDIITVEGELEVHLVSYCARCLKESPFTLKVVIDEKIIKEADLSSFSDLSQETIDEEYRVISNFDLDLTEVVSDEINLVLPQRVLCNKACQGLCPSCGINLNEASCDCDNEQIDPRLAILAELKG